MQDSKQSTTTKLLMAAKAWVQNFMETLVQALYV